MSLTSLRAVLKYLSKDSHFGIMSTGAWYENFNIRFLFCLGLRREGEGAYGGVFRQALMEHVFEALSSAYLRMKLSSSCPKVAWAYL